MFVIPTKPAFLSLPLPTSTMFYLPQHNQSPTTLHTCSMSQANHITHAPVLEFMGLGHHKDLQGFESASFGTLRSTSLFIICSFYYYMLSKLTPYYMFMFPLCINTPVLLEYFTLPHTIRAEWSEFDRNVISVSTQPNLTRTRNDSDQIPTKFRPFRAE